MSESIREQLSALLDGELPIEEEEFLFRQLKKNQEYRVIFGRYTLITELIRSSSSDLAMLNVSERIRAALTEQAPYSALQLPRNSWSTAVKGLVGAGIAASVAILALISLNALDRDAALVPALAELQTGSDSYTVPMVENGDRMAITQARLTSYVVAHGDFFNGPSRLTIDAHMVGKMSGALAVQTVEALPDE
jgi:hypothetical protein